MLERPYEQLTKRGVYRRDRFRTNDIDACNRQHRLLPLMMFGRDVRREIGAQ